MPKNIPTDIYTTIMKRILSILCLAIVVLTASSCQKDTVVAPNNNLTIQTSVSTGGWSSLDNGKTWKQAINVPELDDFANDNSGVLVYLSFTNGVYEQIPEVFNGVSYSYIHERGLLTIYAQAYDGNLTIPNPGTGNVKIVLVDSAQ
jgi:hypothetical protein